jgi:hypothetical protein
MRGPNPQYPILLAEEKGRELRQLIRARKAGQAKVLRARIIVTAHEHSEWSNQQIAREVGTSDRMVRKWRRRWVETQCLDDLPRPGAPRRFSPGGARDSDGAGVQPAPRTRAAV